jgi:hypothetical protein
MRHDRACHSLDRHATYIVATFVAVAARAYAELSRSRSGRRSSGDLLGRGAEPLRIATAELGGHGQVLRRTHRSRKGLWA